MFQHTGKSRTFIHNLKLASLLSFVAGVVNVCGLFAVGKLTTNVTGHFAYFADEMVKGSLATALGYLAFILAFFSGAFSSSVLVELVSRRSVRWMSTVPVSIEALILSVVALVSDPVSEDQGMAVACALLFAMGLQNALVTRVSNSVVRTTHLTGLFTDLGIELSQVFFYRRPQQRQKLYSSIKLRGIIIVFFFIGGVVGGYGFLLYGIQALLLAVTVLLVALVYDSVKLRVVLLRRRLQQDRNQGRPFG